MNVQHCEDPYSHHSNRTPCRPNCLYRRWIVFCLAVIQHLALTAVSSKKMPAGIFLCRDVEVTGRNLRIKILYVNLYSGRHFVAVKELRSAEHLTQPSAPFLSACSSRSDLASPAKDHFSILLFPL
ncbi:hypothetical protein RRG08_051530 [Elysia crispata]|uniref:Uncharacterized protein n=1 Tax=Elysia crispata TaxID=231223 RepID=A0AAE0Y8I1_9GAST|nr:hypothetical protein RRG08_051530 [Elysia crispata]